MISYAQNHEDVLLERCFGTQQSGFYVDVGAWEPVLHSVTQHFYAKGWRGINLEPSPAPFEKLAAERTRDINLPIALSAETGETTFTIVRESGLSTLRELDEKLLDDLGEGGFVSEAVTVTTQTLARVCEEHIPAGTEIDFMKIDVEGWEQEVLQGGDWQRFRPRVLVVEVVTPIGFDPSTKRVSVEDLSPQWEPSLLEHGYLFAASDGLNRYFVRQEDKSLVACFATPVNALDEYMPYYAHLTQADAAAAHARVAELETQLVAAQQRVDALDATVDDVRHQLDLLHTSTSWRLTASVRWLSGWLKSRRARTQ